MDSRIYIVDGARTPFLKARNAPGPFAASDLATAAGSAPCWPASALRRSSSTRSSSAAPALAGRSEHRPGGGAAHGVRLKVPGWTVMRNCASGMQALDSAIANIRTGRSSLVLAGGVDALSRAPLLFSDAMVRWLSGWYASRRSARRRSRRCASSGLGYLAPVIGIMKGLTDPVVGQLMGQTAENLAWKFGISRDEMDAFAVRSHQRVVAAQDAGTFRCRDRAADRS